MKSVLYILVTVISLTSAVLRCPGASDAAHKPGTINCSAPICTNEIIQQNLLFAHYDPTKFYQCAPGLIYYEMSCGSKTCFDFEKQVCVHAAQWNNQCTDNSATTTTETAPTKTTPTTTSTTTTETPPIVTSPLTQEPIETTEQVDTKWTTDGTDYISESTTPYPDPITTADLETTVEIDTTEDVKATESIITTTNIEEFTEETSGSTTREETEGTTVYATESPGSTKKPFSGQICPGSDPSKVTAGTFSCVAPTCNADLVTAKTKFPAAAPNEYYDCWAAQVWRKYTCASGRCFNHVLQKCVDPDEWVNGCLDTV